MEEEKKEGPLEKWKPAVSMVLVQAFLSGMFLLSKVVITDGMFIFALLTYRSLFGALFILPFAFFYERGAWRKLDLKSLIWITFNAFIGYAVPMSLCFYGLQDTTSSYTIIFVNLIPVVTYILALIFRMETLRLRTLPGSLKIIGTLTCFGGTILVSLYKGRVLHLWPAVVARHHQVVQQNASGTNQLRGTILLLASSFTFACWYLLQSKVLKVYPYKYWSSMMTCLFGGIQTGLVGIILKRDRKTWQLGWNLQLLTILYTGAFATAGKYSLNSYAVQKRGPSYPPMFNALSVVFTTILGSLLLGDAITIGSILGVIFIIGGLYLFLFAKGKDLQCGDDREDKSAV
ncbi:WAT1-related protein [Rhynchospora pubera]|uniref:WAT1-related protein n=1 Tax=Rhynchospora pubera TaxID=906938 RepID=A0AAV8EPJ4_9POAL|nr:WAT1-related protein [Rhynchospora pubera]